MTGELMPITDEQMWGEPCPPLSEAVKPGFDCSRDCPFFDVDEFDCAMNRQHCKIFLTMTE